MPLGERAEKDLPADDQIALVRTLLPTARRHGARLTVHGEGRAGPSLRGQRGAFARRQRSRPQPRPLGPGSLIGVSIHTVTEAEAIDPDAVDYAVAGPAYETASKPGYGPEIGRKGLAEIAGRRAFRSSPSAASMSPGWPRCLAAGPAGIAVLGPDPVARMTATMTGDCRPGRGQHLRPPGRH